MTAAIIILLGLTPQRISDDIMSLLHREKSLKDKVLTAQGKRRKSRLQRLFDNMTNALAATHSENKFTLLITAAVIGGCVGVLFGALFNNLLVSVILIAASLVVPYVYVKLLLSNYKKHIFWEWCDTLIECQDNSTQRVSLQPLAARISDIRIVNAELSNMLMQPRKEVFTMIGLVLANYPLIFFLNADWFSVLTDTLFGQIVNCIVAVTIVIVIALTYKYTQPIEFKR